MVLLSKLFSDPMTISLKNIRPVFYLLFFILSSAGSYAQTSFSNTTAIAIPNGPSIPTPGNPYPSPIEVSGLIGTVTSLVVTLNGFNHPLPDGVDIMLVAPDGTNAIIFSDVGGAYDVKGITITLNDGAATSLPDNGQLVSGTFKPTNFGTGDVFTAPAPAPSGQTALSTFNGKSPNGTWKLYVVSDADADGNTGAIQGGWSLKLTTSDAVLPLTWVRFTASTVPGTRSTLLQWTTAQEVNTHSFIIEASDDCEGWKVLGRVKAAGFNYNQQHYRYYDHQPLPGKNFYRLKQVDLDDRFSYSAVIAVYSAAPADQHSIYFNTANAFIQIRANSKGQERAFIQLFDLNGRIVIQKVEILNGDTPYQMNTQRLIAGVYILKVKSNSGETVKKILVRS